MMALWTQQRIDLPDLLAHASSRLIMLDQLVSERHWWAVSDWRRRRRVSDLE